MIARSQHSVSPAPSPFSFAHLPHTVSSLVRKISTQKAQVNQVTSDPLFAYIPRSLFSPVPQPASSTSTNGGERCLRSPAGAQRARGPCAPSFPLPVCTPSLALPNNLFYQRRRIRQCLLTKQRTTAGPTVVSKREATKWPATAAPQQPGMSRRASIMPSFCQSDEHVQTHHYSTSQLQASSCLAATSSSHLLSPPPPHKLVELARQSADIVLSFSSFFPFPLSNHNLDPVLVAREEEADLRLRLSERARARRR